MCIMHNMKSRDLIKEVEKAGWILDRTRGSHHVFRHPHYSHHITIPHPKKELGVGLVRAIHKQAGL
ncbi:type II toxin-antitoxin system HicA family toxin [Zymomonas mobilis]|uniref:YcfA family protein n=1 Tax=Zymomonas mobilis subsp. mobilis (strain ATCC 31821 / ZM4 / CP4) TaxID=264203 RepID=A0A806D8U7_ZYMMO|nr:type II toxin-antitoxin system HicA family toxin [Zymomonas mobilis]ADC33930.1 YcfA family protein [Zymomonas mobilis subsp. mobilis ZM4 = ATCC 31821]AHB11136.1 putative periplasmic or secreted lipoprotein [Zymomonas mobilis subsp. mobilis str. CP4 = NRRL B-14023]AHJ71402.1 YcfA-like protein [Zymomonas mobilis subsp. mobilis NRRL B-12526]AHJ73256.1 YcfA-like protein [Zymomonas mobilis subsp. mobilis str. CP4 = NRRL B-14023]